MPTTCLCRSKLRILSSNTKSSSNPRLEAREDLVRKWMEERNSIWLRVERRKTAGADSKTQAVPSIQLFLNNNKTITTGLSDLYRVAWPVGTNQWCSHSLFKVSGRVNSWWLLDSISSSSSKCKRVTLARDSQVTATTDCLNQSLILNNIKFEEIKMLTTAQKHKILKEYN